MKFGSVSSVKGIYPSAPKSSGSFVVTLPAVINADLWFDRTEATAVIAVAQVIAIQPLRDIRVGQPAVGKQGEFAEQLNLLVFLIFRIDIFCAAGIQVQIPIGGTCSHVEQANSIASFSPSGKYSSIRSPAL